MLNRFKTDTNSIYGLNLITLCTNSIVFLLVFVRLLSFLPKSHLHSKSIICVNYLDDFLIVGDSKNECQNNIVTNLLSSLGFTINSNKCTVRPSNNCEFLGFILNSSKMIISVSEEKRSHISLKIQNLLGERSFKVRDFARIKSNVIAICPVERYRWLYTKRTEPEKYLTLKRNK